MRGYSWTVIPITWRNRRAGQAKLNIKEMGSRYLFICLYVWLEKFLSRRDYVKPDTSAEKKLRAPLKLLNKRSKFVEVTLLVAYKPLNFKRSLRAFGFWVTS